MSELKIQDLFIKELQQLLEKYDAVILAEDHWQGYPECGEDVRMTVEFEDYTINDIDFGHFIDKERHGGIN